MQLKSHKGNNTKASILMVDDNPKNLQVLGNILTNEQYHVEYALNGSTALEWVKRKEFDLILLDVLMPEMDGFEFCRIFKNDNNHRNIPVIFLTAQTDINSIVQGFALGGVDYINKPFNKQELLSRVSTHIELKRSRDIIFQNALELEEKNKLITQSLQYGEKIQNAILSTGYQPLKSFSEYFLILKPKDIISGDFFWSYELDGRIIIAVMDCTGHGVPGALMSMLGITFLNETVISERISVPGMILNRLRDKIIKTLGQKGSMEEIHDGMDGAVISIDTGNNMLDFSGAFNSLIIIRDNNLKIMKGDKIPIGHFDSISNFSTQNLTLLKNDIIYLFTDGYPDQFGGRDGLKFKTQTFKDMLLEINEKPLSVQKELLVKNFDQWKGDYEQVDDVTVLGIRI